MWTRPPPGRRTSAATWVASHLVGAFARAGAGTVGAVSPALLAFGVKDRVAVGVLAGAFFAAAMYFLLERRDRGWLRCVDVTACLTLLAGALVPVAVQAALTHDPRAPSAWTTRAAWTLSLSAQRLLDAHGGPVPLDGSGEPPPGWLPWWR